MTEHADSGVPAEPSVPPPAETAPPAGTARPRPQYGEYATPKEVAIARGIPLDRGANEHVDRLAAPLPPPDPKRAAKKPIAPLASLRQAPAPSGRPVSARHPTRFPPMLTVLLLVFGIWNTVTSIASFLDFGSVLTESFRIAGLGDVTFGPVAHVVGILLLVVSLLLLIGAVGLSLRRIRAGLPSVRVPLIAGGIWIIALLIGFTVIVANTPAAVTLLQNHS